MYCKIPKRMITKIAILKTDCKMSLQQVVTKYKPNYVLNGGLYDMRTGKVNPIPLRIDGRTVGTSSDGYWCLAWNTGPDIQMIHSRDMEKWKNAIACSSMLKDGKETDFIYTSAQGGVRGRTGFGSSAEDVHVFVTTDGAGPVSPVGLRTAMKSMGCLNGIMLDCGGSSQLYDNGKFYQGEKRKVSYWIAIWTTTVPNTKVSTSVTSKATSVISETCPHKEPVTLIRNGSSGEGAKCVQWHLWRLNYLATASEVDGKFGAKSTTALKKFQEKVFTNPKECDGICGFSTRTRLKAALK